LVWGGALVTGGEGSSRIIQGQYTWERARVFVEMANTSKKGEGKRGLSALSKLIYVGGKGYLSGVRGEWIQRGTRSVLSPRVRNKKCR